MSPSKDFDPNDGDDEDTGRLFIVANRLPISIKQRKDGTFDFTTSSGGLASSLAGLSQKVKFLWFGWPGVDVHRNDKDELRKRMQNEYGAVPVFLSKQLAEAHYNGFANSTLWPLLHRLPEKASSKSEWSDAYKEVNETFADVLLPHLEDGDTVWIHDYHLLLLPTALRERLRNKKVRLGFFLHTPFPSEDYYSILPFREAICNGLFNCDVIGFHVPEYVASFLDSAEKALPDVERSPHDLHYQGRKIIVHHFPIGIDPTQFHRALQQKDSEEEFQHLLNTFKGKKLLVSVDRLDYIKGIPQKLTAFDHFLTEHPEYAGKVALVQLAIPSREGVPEYNQLRDEVERLVGRVNGRHSTTSYTPVVYLYQSLAFPKLCALYAAADGCVVSSVRDGLNLVSYEFIACQKRKADDKEGVGPGLLLLSHYTGARTMLGSSLIFNPWDTPRFAETIKTALEMPREERQKRYEEAAEVVESRTSLQWGLDFLETMKTLKISPDEEPAGVQQDAEAMK
ncbi:Alpha,alpha-trehalose-phosphate synthase [UDP-forming] 1 [Cyphellophora attinorum]|uniref:Alpha,alpha-trehalose-phosphate synthase [UDP-forming] 1 n=1 Tax=Cyphellophora attinorum TaxID=1664694 RepID=A0A0N1NWZ1_9EURO|nr:Alpha,alpha-trehalose-phosphate synthase [UDP-forming] 1 [Phialophora attinorum]KPI36452.1 Alpha,alpha-trehalose-phosphate synthase [UDP-forming] 1 [Phialophora attinorum]